jgi:hypothetical protein
VDTRQNHLKIYENGRQVLKWRFWGGFEKSKIKDPGKAWIELPDKRGIIKGMVQSAYGNFSFVGAKSMTKGSVLVSMMRERNNQEEVRSISAIYSDDDYDLKKTEFEAKF